MTFGSRQKGKVGEREAAKLLEVWWGQLEPGCRFVSSPLSGGFSSPQVRAGMKLSGDLCTTAEKFPFVVEVKRREKWNMERLMADKPSPVNGWWEQCQRAALEQGGKPLLLFRKNREPWHYMALAEDLWCLGSPMPANLRGMLVVGELVNLLKQNPADFVK